jgi:hypothetical protein
VPLLFSYGTLQEERVQLSTFGRRLRGEEDALPGYEPALVKVEDARFVASSGRTHHANVVFTGGADSRVTGTVFEITEAELAAADRYEAPAAYARTSVVLASGRQAWLYVHASSADRPSGRRRTVLVFGATGTAGSGILQACLRDPDVSEVRAVVRRPLAVVHEKLRALVHQDYLDYAGVGAAFADVDACFYALGISVRQVPDEAAYRRITRDFALAAAAALRAASPAAVFHYVSGQGTALGSRFLWARVKAEAERDLAGVTATVCWRPAFVDGGAAPTGPRLHRALRPVFRALRFARSLSVTSEDIGAAMLAATADGLRGGIVENARIRALAERRRTG